MKTIAMTSAIVFTSLVLIGTFALQSFAKIDPGTVAAMWLFDEGSGETAIDSSGNGHDGTLINRPKWVQGKFGRALELDGADDYINCGNVPVNPESLSVFAWVKGPTQPTTNGKWIIGKHDNGKAKRSWVIGFGGTDDSTLFIGIMEVGDASAYKLYLGSIVVGDDEWHHVGFTWNSGELKLYVDGVEDKNPDKQNDDKFTSFTNYDDVDLVMGTHLNNGQPRFQDCFTGVIDEVVVFNAVLTQADIKSLMNGAERSVLAISSAGKLAGVWGAIKVR